MTASKSLPARPSLESLRKQAKKLVRDVAAGDAAAMARARAHLPKVDPPLTQRNAQLVIAREYGFAGWQDLTSEVSTRLGKRMFSLAVQAGKLVQKPHFPMLRENNVRAGFFEREQYLAVQRHVPTSMQPVVTFAYVTGWRINSEVLPLQWRQVDLKVGEVRLDPGTT